MKAVLKSRLISILLLLSMLIGLMPVTAYAATIVGEADVLITYPVHLASPDGYAQIYGGTCRVDTSINSSGYVNGVRWKDLRTGLYMSESDTFVGGRDYELSIRLITGTGYNFSDTKTAITIYMEPATLVVTDLNHATVTITLKAAELYINYTNIVELNYPAVDDTPDTNFDTEEENCTIMDAIWTDLTDGSVLPYYGAKFKAGHAYKLSFELWANNGYIFPDNAAVFVSGKLATVTREDDYELKVSVEYPALEEKTPAHTHSPSEWRTTQVYHYKVCTTCGDFLDQEDHKGGAATCNEKGRCTVCDYAYIEENENHVPDTSKWLVREGMYHYHVCKLCGAHCDIEDHRWSPKYHSVGSSGHAYECADCHAFSETVPHEAGPAGTPDAEVVCKDCGYMIAPAAGHEHVLTLVPEKDSTCSDPGNIEYYTCSGCSDLFSDSNGENKIVDTVIFPTGHKASDDWQSDGDYHWRVCSHCGEILTETKMVHEMTDGKCVDCCYGKSNVGTATEPQSGDEGNGDGKGTPKSNNGTDVIVMIIVALAAALLGAVTAYFIIKKKNASK